MSIAELALVMWPSWAIGIFMILATIYSGNADLLKIDTKSVKHWCKLLAFISVCRAIGMYVIWNLNYANSLAVVSWIPWQLTLTVFWEDATHVLPLLLLIRMIGVSKKTLPIHVAALVFMWASFGVGHIYQGIWSAIYLSFYIPLTLKIAKDKGIGTVMVCHVLYDLCTISLVQIMLKAMV